MQTESPAAELLERFGSGPMTAEAINAGVPALWNVLIERALGVEMNQHLGYAADAAKPGSLTKNTMAKAPRPFRDGLISSDILVGIQSRIDEKTERDDKMTRSN